MKPQLTKEEFKLLAHRAGFDPEYDGRTKIFHLHPKSTITEHDRPLIESIITTHSIDFTFRYEES